MPWLTLDAREKLKIQHIIYLYTINIYLYLDLDLSIYLSIYPSIVHSFHIAPSTVAKNRTNASISKVFNPMFIREPSIFAGVNG